MSITDRDDDFPMFAYEEVKSPSKPKEILDKHSELIDNFEWASSQIRTKPYKNHKSVLDQVEVCRSNLRAFERLHGLTPHED